MGCLGCEATTTTNDKEKFDSPPVTLMQHSGYCCIRYAFCIFNCLIWVGACGLLGVGIWLRVVHGGYANLLPHLSLFSVDSLVITIGVVAFVTAFFGCCGAWFQQQFSLIVYFVLAVVITVAELGAVTVLFVYHDEIGHSFRHELKRGIQLHYNATEDPRFDGLVDIWDDIQQEFRCCGVNSYKDWFHVTAWMAEDQIPTSCCRPEIMLHDSCRTIDPLPSEIFTDGCYAKVQDWLLERLHIVGIGGLILAFLQLFGMVSSILLYCTLRDIMLQAAPFSPYKAYEPA